MRGYKNFGASVLAVTLFFSGEKLCRAMDVAQEQWTITSYEKQVKITCSAPGLSVARIDIGGRLMRRIDSKLGELAAAIERENRVLDHPSAFIEDRFALLAQARETERLKRVEYNTAQMYKRYPTIDLARARFELTEARDRVAALRVENAPFATRGLASSRETAKDVEAATAETSELADFSDHYLDLRKQVVFCIGKSFGFPGKPIEKPAPVNPDRDGSPGAQAGH